MGVVHSFELFSDLFHCTEVNALSAPDGVYFNLHLKGIEHLMNFCETEK